MFNHYEHVIGYCRQSTNNQADTLDNQEAIIKNFCETNNINDVTIIKETGSAFNDNYYNLNIHNIIANLQNDSLIIVSDVSRFSRNCNMFSIIDSVMYKNSNIVSIIDKCELARDYTTFMRLLNNAWEESDIKSKKLKTYHEMRKYRDIQNVLLMLKKNNFTGLKNYKCRTSKYTLFTKPEILEYIFNLHKVKIKKIVRRKKLRFSRITNKYLFNIVKMYKKDLKVILEFYSKTILYLDKNFILRKLIKYAETKL